MMRFLCTLALLATWSGSVFAQSAGGPWKALPQSSVALATDAQLGPQPRAFRVFNLDQTALTALLAQAPQEFSDAARTQPLQVDLPTFSGQMRPFHVVTSSVMAPELMAKFPEIRTYAGMAADGSGDMVRLGVSSVGFHAFFFKTDGDVEIIQTTLFNRADVPYLVYRLKDLPADAATVNGAIKCGVEDDVFGAGGQFGADFWAMRATDRGATPVQLKKYRMAIAAQGEYSEMTGGTVPSVMASIVTALNFIVAITERDFDVRFELVANNDQLIYLDKNTDPYNGDLTDWIGDNHILLNTTIGTANYDIGHMFGKLVPASPLAGLAGGRVCNALNKGAGGSSGNPVGTAQFYLVAAHEMCHQMSGSHTWSNCTTEVADQLAPNSAYEPGSGTTIMSYAGSCASNNVVSNNDSEQYYHIESIEQVQSFVFSGAGASCGTLETTNNNAPVADFSYNNGFYIPISTPFQLTGSGSDPDGDALTYCWEQHDLGPTTQLGQASGTSPLFRSFLPSTNPTRVFPRMNLIANNSSSPAELLPNYSRSLSFRLTVRDNRTGGGGVGTKELSFFSTTEAGPFVVTAPNTTGVVWPVGSSQLVTWDVANTNKAPVNCQTVNIKLSTDAGLTYPITLASGVPNNGRYCITVPNNITSTARVRVEAADNIFFDISNLNLTINQPAQPGVSLCASLAVGTACQPEAFSTDISVTGLAGFTQPVTLSASGLPANASAFFSANPVNPGQSSNLSLEFAPGTPEGSYTITVTATAGSVTNNSTVVVNVVNNNFSAFALEQPANGATGVDLTPTLFWNGVPDADFYEVQVASNPSFNSGVLVASTGNTTVDTFKITQLLPEGSTYYWRVRPVNSCNNAPWSDTYVFNTKQQSCTTFSATDLPKTISTNGTPTVESKITVNANAIIGDVNVKSITGNHNFFKDLEIRLLSPLGTNVLLVKDKCPTAATFNMGFDDNGTTFACPPSNNGTLRKPETVLSAMNNENMTGVWTLRVKDNTSGSGGNLTGFQLELCSSASTTGPVIVTNNPLQLQAGTNALIDNNLLLSTDANNTAEQLTYTVMTAPANGELRLNGFTLQAGGQFKQTDLNNGAIRYYDYGLNNGPDDFRFSVTDGEGGLAAGTFLIQPQGTATRQPGLARQVLLSPNPASSQILLNFSESVAGDTRIRLFNMSGQALRHWVMPGGAQTLMLPVQDVPDGIYSVSIEDASGVLVKKVVIRK
jgi:subtilisin-like proprotein convertase family protein